MLLAVVRSGIGFLEYSYSFGANENGERESYIEESTVAQYLICPCVQLQI